MIPAPHSPTPARHVPAPSSWYDGTGELKLPGVPPFPRLSPWKRILWAVQSWARSALKLK